jgi:hypothetical protein
MRELFELGDGAFESILRTELRADGQIGRANGSRRRWGKARDLGNDRSYTVARFRQ